MLIDVAVTITTTLLLQLSPECRSLLDRIFEPNVKQRITVEGIMEHPWYQKPLPGNFQTQIQHLEQVQAQKDAHMRSRRLDPVSLLLTLFAMLHTEDVERLRLLNKCKKPFCCLNSQMQQCVAVFAARVRVCHSSIWVLLCAGRS